MPGGADGNGMELVAKPQRVDKIDIQYATFAKKVSQAHHLLMGLLV